MTLSIPLHAQERQGHTVHGFCLTNANNVDQLPRLRRWWWRGCVVRRARVPSELVDQA